ncbi:hypothetical protein JZ751_014056, partial [Albula glossodonta]
MVLVTAPEFAASKTYVSSMRLCSWVACPRQLMDPQIFEYSGIWPTDPFVPAAKLTEALAAQLLIPVKFEYTN